jgi:uncharacterized protein YlzI (FlbEa/FlbD family)
VEGPPNTEITVENDVKIMGKESLEEVVEKIMVYRRKIRDLLSSQESEEK